VSSSQLPFYYDLFSLTQGRDRLFILVREHLLSSLSAGHALLLLFPEFGRCKLLRFLGGDDLVAHGIKLLFLIIVVTLQSWTRTLSLNPVVSIEDVSVVQKIKSEETLTLMGSSCHRPQPKLLPSSPW
jgi:hypothetical protein